MINFPFSAIVGQDTMCLALLLNAVNPSIGGVLIRGEKGTAKSTAVRALAALLPDIEVASNSPFPFAPTELPNDVVSAEATGREQRPAPLVNLPLNVSEDRLLGAIDLEAALQKGQRQFEPGLLASAHRGILYIDEVNLLADHIVDVLLDAAALGVNLVEREGISVSHPAKFMLVGTMNPEEGDLRPQLLDRFGLAIEVGGSAERATRTEIVRRRLRFEADPQAFISGYAQRETELRQKISNARGLLSSVTLADHLLDLIADICIAFDVDGMRADLVIHKTARTLAAWEGETDVSAEHVQQAATLALLHRRRRQPFDDPGIDQQQLDDLVQQHQQEREGESESDAEDD